MLTHNVKRFKVEKPAGYTFVPGQATDVAINKPGLENELRPFTFTSLPDADHLEFMIKMYTGHNGMTEKLRDVNAGDELIVHEVFGAIEFKGPGLFIAGGAGITPFVAILRHLKSLNKLQGSSLLFANRTRTDIILKDELEEILGDGYTNVIETPSGRRITKELLKQHLTSSSEHCYVCGPDEFTKKMVQFLEELGVNNSNIIIEK
jgi:ferredoxin-NADP reductase